MDKVSIKVETYLQAVPCECGGVYGEKIGNIILTDPAQTDFKRSKCGSIKRLSETDFPGFKYQW